ncbi:uncharacterized protein METZ01_LOCUS162382, partial [marine metagenome]
RNCHKEKAAGHTQGDVPLRRAVLISEL